MEDFLDRVRDPGRSGRCILCDCSGTWVTTDRIRIRIGDGIGIVRDESDVTYAEDIRETYNGVEKIDAMCMPGR